MKLEVLVATMNRKQKKLIEEMNIKTDAIIINQTDKVGYDEIIKGDNQIKWFDFDERGVGLSRNNSLMRATADICLFADDDVVYDDDYEEKIISTFKKNPKADVIIFNVPSSNEDRKGKNIRREKRLRFYNVMRYGTFRIAVRTEKIKEANIYFSLLFGGGAKYSCGEDTLFLIDSLKAGLKIYSSPLEIGTVSHEESTWFKGYTDKFFIDKGVLFNHISPRFQKVLCFQLLYRKRKEFLKNRKFWNTYKKMIMKDGEI